MAKRKRSRPQERRDLTVQDLRRINARLARVEAAVKRIEKARR
jgi:hypothetical protein